MKPTVVEQGPKSLWLVASGKTILENTLQGINPSTVPVSKVLGGWLLAVNVQGTKTKQHESPATPGQWIIRYDTSTEKGKEGLDNAWKKIIEAVAKGEIHNASVTGYDLESKDKRVQTITIITSNRDAPMHIFSVYDFLFGNAPGELNIVRDKTMTAVYTNCTKNFSEDKKEIVLWDMDTPQNSQALKEKSYSSLLPQQQNLVQSRLYPKQESSFVGEVFSLLWDALIQPIPEEALTTEAEGKIQLGRGSKVSPE